MKTYFSYFDKLELSGYKLEVSLCLKNENSNNARKNVRNIFTISQEWQVKNPSKNHAKSRRSKFKLFTKLSGAGN